MINFLKIDFTNVYAGWNGITKGKAPRWAVILYYCVAFIPGCILALVLKVYITIRMKKLIRDMEKVEA